MGAIRKTLRRWRETASYGSDAPARPRPAYVPPAQRAEIIGSRVSISPIMDATGMNATERGDWMARFRAAETFVAKRAVIDAFQAAHPAPPLAPAAAAAAD